MVRSTSVLRLICSALILSFLMVGISSAQVTLYKGNNAEEDVSAPFMTNGFGNERVASMFVSARSDCGVTFPTKRFHVDPCYVDTLATLSVRSFDVQFGSAPQVPGSSYSETKHRVRRREEEKDPASASDDPPQVANPQLCFETNILTFGCTELRAWIKRHGG